MASALAEETYEAVETEEVAPVETPPEPFEMFATLEPVRRPRIVPLPTLAWFGIALAFLALSATLKPVQGSGGLADGVGLVGGTLFVVSIVIAAARALRGIADLVTAVRTDTSEGVVATLLSVVGNLMLAGFGALVAYVSTVGFARGRQLRRFGRILLPSLREGADWTAVPLGLPAALDAPEGLADQWRENGRTEHASVAAFARLTFDLLALGAPPTLVAAANRDALDEIRHAELCFSLAQALDGRPVGPAPFPQAQRAGRRPRARTLALARLAVDSLVDGALHEGVSARVIAQLARRCAVPEIRDLLREIAADEGRHAAHGWAVAAWCFEQGGAPVGHALLGALRALPPHARSTRPDAARDGGWERWGIHGDARERQAYGEARALLEVRVRALVGDTSGSRAAVRRTAVGDPDVSGDHAARAA